MKTSVKAGWIVTILASTIIFCLCAAGSYNWDTHRVLVQEAVYEYVPASQIQIIARWAGVTAFSILIGIIAGLFIYSTMEEKKHE